MKKKRMNTIPRDINARDAISIDWASAVLEAQECFNVMTNSSHKSWDNSLLAGKLLCEIKNCSKINDIDRYLDILQDHRNFLKLKNI